MTKRIRCANCRREQPDYGKGATCDFCGCSPLPSYSYNRRLPYHPENCRGIVATDAPSKVPYRRRGANS